MEDDKKMTEGEIEEVINEEVILVEDLNEPQKGIPPELEKMIRAKISQMSNGVFSEQEQDEIYDSLNEKDILSSKEKGILENYLNTEIRKIIIEKLREKNKDNESSKEQQEEQQKEDEEEKQQEEQVEQSSQEDLEKVSEEEQEKEEEQNVKEDEKLPAEVIDACERIGINKIKGYFYVNASELNNKVDNTLVDKYGEKVLMLEVPTEKIDGPNKYYGFQEKKMVLYGNEDEAVRDVTGKTRMGEIVEPLKLQEPKAVEYSDGDGLVVNEQIDDNSKVSVQEANNYREEMEDLLEKYSQNLKLISSDTSKSKQEKEEMIYDIKNKFSSDSIELANKYDIKDDDTKNIVTEVEENTNEKIQENRDRDDEDDEPDYFEVPGKLTH